MKSTEATKNQKTNNNKKHKYNNNNNNNNKRIEEATEDDPLLLSSSSSTIVVTSSRDSTNTTTLLFEKIQSLFIKMSGKSSSGTGGGIGDDDNFIHTTTIDENISNSIDHEPNHDDGPSLLSYGSSGVDGGNTTLNTNDSSIDQNFIRSIRSIRSARSDELSRGGGGGRRANSSGSSYPNQYSQQQHYQYQHRNNNNHHYHHHSRQHQHDGRAEKLHEYYNQRAKSIFSERRQRTEPLIEVSSEVMDVRRRALKVYEPLTYTWVSLYKKCIYIYIYIVYIQYYHCF